MQVTHTNNMMSYNILALYIHDDRIFIMTLTTSHGLDLYTQLWSGSYSLHAGMVRIGCMQEWLMLTFIVCMHAVWLVRTYIYLYAGVAQLLCMHAEVAHNLSCSSSRLACKYTCRSGYIVVWHALEMIVWLVSTCNDLTLFLPELNSYILQPQLEGTDLVCIRNPYRYIYTLALLQIPAHSLHPLQSH